MSWILGLLGFLIGILVYFAVGMVLPHTKGRVANFYFKQALSCYRRCLLEVNRHHDAELHPSTYNHDIQADEINTNEQHDYEDRSNAMTTLFGRPFGIVYSEYNEIIQPADVTIADRLYQAVDAGKHILTDEDGQPRGFCPHVAVPEGYHFVDVSNVQPRLIEGFEPNDPEKAESDIENSQQGFQSRNTIEIMIVIIAAIGSSVLAWLIWSNTAGESTVTIPVQIATALVGVVA